MCWQWAVTSASMVDAEQVSGQLKDSVPYVDVLQLSPCSLLPPSVDTLLLNP